MRRSRRRSQLRSGFFREQITGLKDQISLGYFLDLSKFNHGCFLAKIQISQQQNNEGAHKRKLKSTEREEPFIQSLAVVDVTPLPCPFVLL